MDATNLVPAVRSHQDQHRSGDRYNRGAEHVSPTGRLLERLRQAKRAGECPSSISQLQQAAIFGLSPVNCLGDLRRLCLDIHGIKCRNGVYGWELHGPPGPLEQNEWRRQGRRQQLFLPERLNCTAWEDWKRAQTDRLECPLSSGDLLRFAGARK